MLLNGTISWLRHGCLLLQAFVSLGLQCIEQAYIVLFSGILTSSQKEKNMKVFCSLDVSANAFWNVFVNSCFNK